MKTLIFALVSIFLSTVTVLPVEPAHGTSLLQRAIQSLVLPHTVEMDYICETKDGDKWNFSGSYRVILNAPKPSFSVTSYSSPSSKEAKVIGRNACKDGIVTRFDTDHLSRSLGTVEKVSPEWKTDITGEAVMFLEYFKFHEYLAFDGVPNPYLQKSMISKDGKKILKIEDSHPDISGWLKFMFLFDSKTGCLQEAEFYDIITDGSKAVKKPHLRWTISEYATYKGITFPSNMEIHSLNSGHRGRFLVDKKTLKINEPIDEKVYDVTFPPGTRVHDKIKNQVYVIPALGNAEAEEKIVKELDALYEKARKQK